MKDQGAKKLEKLLKHVSPQDMPVLIKTLQEIGLNTNTVKSILRAHEEYRLNLKNRMYNVPHSVEEQVKQMDTIDGVRTIRERMEGLGLKEALLFYKYFKFGLIPWFME